MYPKGQSSLLEGNLYFQCLGRFAFRVWLITNAIFKLLVKTNEHLFSVLRICSYEMNIELIDESYEINILAKTNKTDLHNYFSLKF